LDCCYLAVASVVQCCYQWTSLVSCCSL
jgi:hypothetical protein